jgi:hypothetical protein
MESDVHNIFHIWKMLRSVTSAKNSSKVRLEKFSRYPLLMPVRHATASSDLCPLADIERDCIASGLALAIGSRQRRSSESVPPRSTPSSSSAAALRPFNRNV